ncbi:MAG: hypothetical protein WC763_05065 [Candidatus Paceibacterota bacterium]|jgi:hypothetical protein
MNGPSETQIQRTILDGLLYKGIMAWRNNVAAVPIRRGKAIVGFRRADLHVVGMPDILSIVSCPCCAVGVLVGIEVKSHGKKQKPEQKHWQEKMENNGAFYILAHSFDEALDGIESIKKKMSEMQKNLCHKAEPLR